MFVTRISTAPPSSPRHLARERREPLEVSGVGLERRRLALDLCRRHVEALERAAHHRDLRPLARERPGDPRADPLARAHDERDAALYPQIHMGGAGLEPTTLTV